MTSSTGSGPKSLLEDISTRWGQLHDPLQFVMRYASAIQKYLRALIPNAADAEDACQNFLTHWLSRDVATLSPERGQFRKYLKAAVRNCALMHYRRQQSATQQLQNYAQELTPATVQEPAADQAVEQAWLAEWKQCLLDRAWSRLHQQTRRDGSNLPYVVLRTAVDFRSEDSTQLAARVAAQTGVALRADTFRKHLSRAREAFARILIDEVRDTLQDKSRSALEEELTELELLRVVQNFLD